MSESDFTPKPQPLVLRVEISAEQASALAPIFDGAGVTLPAALPAVAPVSDEEVDSRVRELELREAEFEAWRVGAARVINELRVRPYGRAIVRAHPRSARSTRSFAVEASIP